MYGDAVTALEEPRKAEPEKKPEKAKTAKNEPEQKQEPEDFQDTPSRTRLRFFFQLFILLRFFRHFLTRLSKR